MGEKAEDALAIVGCNGDDALASHSVAGIARFAAAASYQSAAVEVDKNRQMLVHVLCRCPDIEIQAVFAHLLRAEVHVAEYALLHRVGSELLCLSHALPLCYGLRSLPTEVAHGWSSKRNALECLYARLVDAFECAFRNVYSCGLLCEQCSCEQCKHECQK